jgi:hypothetical protein
VLHAISFVPVTILGVLFMVGEGLTLAGARELAATAGEADGAAAAAPPSETEDRRTRPVADPPVGEPVKRGAR